MLVLVTVGVGAASASLGACDLLTTGFGDPDEVLDCESTLALDYYVKGVVDGRVCPAAPLATSILGVWFNEGTAIVKAAHTPGDRHAFAAVSWDLKVPNAVGTHPCDPPEPNGRGVGNSPSGVTVSVDSPSGDGDGAALNLIGGSTGIEGTHCTITVSRAAMAPGEVLEGTFSARVAMIGSVLTGWRHHEVRDGSFRILREEQAGEGEPQPSTVATSAERTAVKEACEATCPKRVSCGAAADASNVAECEYLCAFIPGLLLEKQDSSDCTTALVARYACYGALEDCQDVVDAVSAPWDRGVPCAAERDAAASLCAVVDTR